ncbi:MAG: ComEC/Rec2 family competence protein [Flavobacteriaceae bacterium]
MQLLRFVPIKLTIFLVVGILIGNYLGATILFSLLTALVSLCLLGWLFLKSVKRDAILFGIATLTTTVSIGILAISLWLPENWEGHYSHSDLQRAHGFGIKITEVLKPNAFTNRYIGMLIEVDGHHATGKIMLNSPNDSSNLNLKVDQELLVYGHLDEIKAPLNPHQFDYRKYLHRLGIYHELRLTKENYSLSEYSTVTIYGLAAAFRNKISSKLKETDFGQDELGIIQALLLGQRADISETTYDNYKNAGAVHILAVSGLHIGILLMLLQFIFRPIESLPKGKTIKLIIIVVQLWGFALVAGFSASVVRAVTMFTFVAYALYLNRPSNTFNILALSMFFILLLINPMLLFQVGFQMSYAAVFAIVWIYPLLQRLWFPKNVVVRKLWQLLSVSVAAQLGVLPISLFYFHQFPGLFFISNLLIVPFLGLVLGMGILVIILSLLNWLPDFLVKLYDTLIRLMNTVIEWVAQQEAFIFENIPFDSTQLLLSYAVIFSLLAILTKSTFKRVVVFLSSILLFQLWSFYATYQASKKETLLLAHQTQNSVLMYQKGGHIDIFTTKPEVIDRIVTAYSIAERTVKLKHEILQNSYQFGDKSILFIDSVGVYSENPRADYLVLIQSPKINLERLLDSIRPKILIADGSNYRSSIDRWKTTCAKRKLPFHYTGEKGAYYFD